MNVHLKDGVNILLFTVMLIYFTSGRVYSGKDGDRMEMKGRKNGMLTTEDRRWLTGEKSYTGPHAKQQRYQRRRDIRERVYNSILDFSILLAGWEQNEREKVFETVRRTRTPDYTDEFTVGLRDSLAFILHNTDLRLVGGDPSSNTIAPIGEQLLYDAIDNIAASAGREISELSLHIDSTELQQRSSLDALRRDDELTREELETLMQHEQIDDGALREFLREQLLNGGTE